MGAKPLFPSESSRADDDLSEVAAILADGYLRCQLRNRLGKARYSRDLSNIPLDFTADQSVSVEQSDDGDST
jgi:hypothetical protein